MCAAEISGGFFHCGYIRSLIQYVYIFPVKYRLQGSGKAGIAVRFSGGIISAMETVRYDADFPDADILRKITVQIITDITGEHGGVQMNICCHFSRMYAGVCPSGTDNFDRHRATGHPVCCARIAGYHAGGGGYETLNRDVIRKRQHFCQNSFQFSLNGHFNAWLCFPAVIACAVVSDSELKILFHSNLQFM